MPLLTYRSVVSVLKNNDPAAVTGSGNVVPVVVPENDAFEPRINCTSSSKSSAGVNVTDVPLVAVKSEPNNILAPLI